MMVHGREASYKDAADILHILEGNADNRVAPHVFIAECPVLIAGEIPEEPFRSASVLRILIVHFQKTGQHAHGKRLSESPGPQNLKNPVPGVRSSSRQEVLSM